MLLSASPDEGATLAPYQTWTRTLKSMQARGFVANAKIPRARRRSPATNTALVRGRVAALDPITQIPGMCYPRVASSTICKEQDEHEHGHEAPWMSTGRKDGVRSHAGHFVCASYLVS